MDNLFNLYEKINNIICRAGEINFFLSGKIAFQTVILIND